MSTPDPTPTSDTGGVKEAAKPTPGDWYARKSPRVNGNDDLWEVCWSPDAECVAEIVHGEGNARLMAAAKALFEVLRGISECAGTSSSFCISSNDGTMKRIRAALSIATGGQK